MTNRVQTDRFGNAYQIKGFKENKNGYLVAYMELGGKLYKFEYNNAQNPKNPEVKAWLKCTKVNKQRRQTSM